MNNVPGTHRQLFNVVILTIIFAFFRRTREHGDDTQECHCKIFWLRVGMQSWIC